MKTSKKYTSGFEAVLAAKDKSLDGPTQQVCVIGDHFEVQSDEFPIEKGYYLISYTAGNVDKELITIPDYASLLNLSRQRVYAMIAAGKILTEERRWFGKKQKVIDVQAFPPDVIRKPGRPAGSSKC